MQELTAGTDSSIILMGDFNTFATTTSSTIKGPVAEQLNALLSGTRSWPTEPGLIDFTARNLITRDGHPVSGTLLGYDCEPDEAFKYAPETMPHTDHICCTPIGICMRGTTLVHATLEELRRRSIPSDHVGISIHIEFNRREPFIDHIL
jgi:hypothetical protein